MTNETEKKFACGHCKEGSYWVKCPIHWPSSPKGTEGWEGEYDEKIGSCYPKRLDCVDTTEIKAFIRDLLAKAREEGRAEWESTNKQYMSRQEDFEAGRAAERAALVTRIEGMHAKNHNKVNEQTHADRLYNLMNENMAIGYNGALSDLLAALKDL